MSWKEPSSGLSTRIFIPVKNSLKERNSLKREFKFGSATDALACVSKFTLRHRIHQSDRIPCLIPVRLPATQSCSHSQKHPSTAQHRHKVSSSSHFESHLLNINFFIFLVHDFYSSHVHQMASHAAARQSPTDPSNHNNSPISNASHPMHNPAASAYYHHYHHSATSANQNSAEYSPPQNVNGNESPSSVDQFTNANNNNIQLPETPNSMGTTNVGPTSGNSNSNDGANVLNSESVHSENAAAITNNNYSPWCGSTGHHQLPLTNSSPLHAGSYNSAHHPSASLYSAHNLSSTLIPHQNISQFHPHSGKSFGMSQPFYSGLNWY